MNLDDILNKIEKPSEEAIKESRKRWDSISKPLRSLGLLEEAIIKIAGIQENSKVNINKKALIVMCADNGVVCENVTQTGMEITALVTENFTKNKTSASVMANSLNVDVFPVDIGVYRNLENVIKKEEEIVPRKIIDRKIGYGTKNLYKEPAMTEEETIKAIKAGINMVRILKEKGYKIIATGEMGIGNTTTSSALASVFLDKSVETVTGKGAGLSIKGLERKIEVIKSAIKLHKPNKNNPIDVLSKLGGFDIAGLVGVFLGGSLYKVPIVIDGFISGVSALIACKINPLVSNYILPSHVSKEPAGKLILDALNLKPLLNCEMCLGEGTGAISIFPILDLALTVYNNMVLFDEQGFCYKPL